MQAFACGLQGDSILAGWLLARPVTKTTLTSSPHEPDSSLAVCPPPRTHPTPQSKRTSVAKTGLLQRIHSTLGCLPCLEYTLVRDPTGRYRADGDSDDERADAAGGVGGGNNLGAGVAEQQVAQVATLGAATLGAAMLGGTAMMGTAGLAMLPVA